jgi:hypothetical protein
MILDGRWTRSYTQPVEVIMIAKIVLETEVPPNREIRLKAPEEVPLGPVGIEVVFTPPQVMKRNHLGDLAKSEFFGMWKDREDIADSEAFAKKLREAAWRR